MLPRGFGLPLILIAEVVGRVLGEDGDDRDL